MGPYWFDTWSEGPFARWAPKITHLDMAIETSHFPRVKRAFNPPGRRKFLFIGNGEPYKGAHLLSHLFGLAGGKHQCVWIGADRDLPNLERRSPQRLRGAVMEQLARDGWARVALPRPYRPFADGAPTPSGKVEFYAASLERHGLPALPTYVPLIEGPERRELTARFPLQCIVPPNRFFLNSSFSQSALLRRRQGTATAMLAPADAAARGIGEGDTVLVESARGSARFAARITDATRPGVVVIEGIWWHRFSPGGRGVNVLTSDRVADLGGGPAFHSNLVEVHKA